MNFLCINVQHGDTRFPFYLRLIFICILLNSATICHISGKDIFISSSSGSDSNDGSTENLAIKTLLKLQQEVADNDSIFFKKGDVWRGEIWYNSRSSIFVGTYGIGDLPIITLRDTIEMAMDTSSWENSTGNWRVHLGFHPSRLFVNGIEKLRAANLVNLGVPDSQDTVGLWFATAGYLYYHSELNPALNNTLFEGSDNNFTFTFENTSNCFLDSLRLEGGNTYSIRLSNSDSTTIKNCEIGKDARGGLLLRNGSDVNMIDNVKFDSHFTQYYGYASNTQDTDRGVGDGINLNNDASYNIISNCTFKNWSHNALEISHNFQSESTDSTNHNQFIYNDIEASDISYAHPFGADGPKNRCSYNEWAYIYANNCRTAIQVNGNNNHVHNSILSNFKQSPSKSTVTSPALWCAVYEATDNTELFVFNVSEYNLFENLLIYNTDESAIRIEDFGYEDRVVNNIVFRNCIIVNPGLNPINGDYNDGTAVYFEDVGTIDSILFENNLVFQDSLPDNFSFYLSNSNQYLDFDTFNILNYEFGVGANSNINSDPDLINNIPSDSSIAINSGINAQTQPSADFAGNDRIVDGRIDIGPYENQMLCQDRAVRYVDLDAVGSETGTTWQDAYTTIDNALAECTNDNIIEFWVAEGEYYPTSSLDRNISISLPSSSTLYGGWNGDEYRIEERDFNLNITILSGDIGGNDDQSDNSLSVISQDSDSLVVFDGVTVQDGFGANKGAGLHLQNSFVRLVNMTIKNNISIVPSQIYVLDGELSTSNVSIQNMDVSGLNVIFDPIPYSVIIELMR